MWRRGGDTVCFVSLERITLNGCRAMCCFDVYCFACLVVCRMIPTWIKRVLAWMLDACRSDYIRYLVPFTPDIYIFT